MKTYNGIRKTIFILSLLSIVYAGCKKNDEEDPAPPLSGREQAVADYKNMYLTTEVSTTELAWSGDEFNCKEGTVSQSALDKVLMRINYFRKICGLPHNITYDATRMNKCQKMALMCHANGTISHSPPKSWSCYSADGASVSSSNLAYGSHSTGSIRNWMRDDGANNAAAGHRRWIIFSRLKTTAIGTTDNYAALWCHTDFTSPLPNGIPAYVPYPPTYIPQALVFARWSLSVPNPVSFFSGVDFFATTVVMKDDAGKNIPVNIISKDDDGAGDQSIVWQPAGIVTNSTKDVKYHVVVDNVIVNGVKKKYEYDVNILKM